MNYIFILVLSVLIVIHGGKAQTWTKQWGSLKQITASEGIICGIDKETLIQCAVNGVKSSSPDWVLVPPPATSTPLQVAIYGREMVMVDTTTAIYRAYYNGNATQWSKIPGSLKQISIDGSQVCGCNAAGSIFCGNYNRYSLSFPQQCATENIPAVDHPDMTLIWVHIPGGLKEVTVRAGRLFGTINGVIFFGKSYGPVGWLKIPGTLSHVAYDFDKNRLCGVQENNDIFCATEDIFTAPKWEKISGALINLDIWNNRLYGVNSANEIFTTAF